MTQFVYSLLFLCLTLFPGGSDAASKDFKPQRLALVAAIEHDVQETSRYIGKAALNPKVMEAMRKVPRHKFVPADLVEYAYQNRPLPIGYGQTISQPFIVALMTDLLEVTGESVVLEIGTGSGYQAAVMAELVASVYSIEIIEPLAKRTEKLLRNLALTNIHTTLGDGYHGWPEKGPFDAIIVTAAADHVPPPLLKQLKKGGRMVIPVGSRFQTQQLLLITKKESSQFTTQQILPVVFVPLTGDH